MHRHIVFFVAAIIMLIVKNAYAQPLTRKVFLGVKLEEITDDAKRIMGADVKNGALITEVFAASTAEKAGFKKGDILLLINNHEVTGSHDAVAYIGRQTAGADFTYELWRDKKQVKGKAVFLPLPGEQYKGIEMVYAEAATPLGNERMIISKPATQTKKMPAIVFIGGIGCYSLDFLFDSTRTEVQFLNRLTRAGFVCARAEKPGMGDNWKTKACGEVSFMEEMESYTAMIKALKKRSDVDSDAIYIFGHSMGGVFAPLIAERTSVKGVIAYGTIGSNFLEYLVKTRKTIMEAYNADPEESDKLVKDFCECAVYYFTDKMTSEQAGKKKQGCKDMLSLFDLRSRAYNDELYAFSIPTLWKTYKGKALFLWGTADYISSEDDHEMLARTVNYYHPGSAAVVKVKNSDHGMHTAASFADARNNPGAYNAEVGRIVLDWLQKK